MKEQVLTDGIAGFTNGGANTAAEFRTYETNNKTNTYSPITIDSESLEVYTQEFSVDRSYWGQITKQGRYATFRGWVRNDLFSSIGPGSKIFSLRTTVGGNPSDVLPDDTVDPISGVAIVFEATFETAAGTLLRVGVKNDATLGNGLYALDAMSPQGNNPASRYFGEITWNVKE